MTGPWSIRYLVGPIGRVASETRLSVPSGTLNLVSLATLPIGRTKYLINQGPVVERDLASNVTTSSINRGLLAIGGAA